MSPPFPLSDVIALFTYELAAAKKNAEEAQITFHPLSTLTVLLQTAIEEDRISEEESEEILRFAHDPQGWMQ